MIVIALGYMLFIGTYLIFIGKPIIGCFQIILSVSAITQALENAGATNDQRR